MIIKTPILDKFGLHPFGGICTCFSSPYSVCQVCKKSKEAKNAWAKLTANQRLKALKEIELAYPSTSNQDGR